MISAVALGPADTVYSAKRLGTATFVCSSSATAATPLYRTSDSVHGVHVSSSGAIHAIGKARYHTNAGGAWRSTKFSPTNGSSVHAITDDDLLAVTMKGGVYRSNDSGATWREIASYKCFLREIVATSAADVFVLGRGVLARFDGENVTKLLESDSFVGMHASAGVTWVCGNKCVYQLKGTTLETIVERSHLESSLYGIGVGSAGVFVHLGYEIDRVDGTTLVCARGNEDQALMVRNATYSTAISSNGRRVVAGGARSVLVEDGNGFVEWPELTEKAAKMLDAKPAKVAAKPAKPAAAKPAKPAKAAAKPAKPAKAAAKPAKAAAKPAKKAKKAKKAKPSKKK